MAENKGYATADEAAVKALQMAMTQSSALEYAGVLYEKDGRFYYTEAKTSGRKDKVRVTIKYPKGTRLVALYHTHPEGKDSDMFSSGDVEIARQLEIPYYMGHIPDSTIRVFQPGKSKVERRRRGTRNGYQAEGELVTPKPPASTEELQTNEVPNQRQRHRPSGVSAEGLQTDVQEGFIPRLQRNSDAGRRPPTITRNRTPQ